MGFWEKIDKTGERIDIYEKIKKDNTPLYIYGAGNLAKNIKWQDVLQILVKKNLKVIKSINIVHL